MRRLRPSFFRIILIAVRKLFAIIALVAVLAGGAAAVAVWLGWERIHEPYRGYAGPEQFVTIRQGAGSAEIGQRVRAGTSRRGSTGSIVRSVRLTSSMCWCGATCTRGGSPFRKD